MDNSLFFSFIPIQKRILLGSVTFPFQQVLPTGGPTLSTSAVLDTPSVPAVEHHLSQHLLCTGVAAACRSHRSMVSTSFSLRSFFRSVYLRKGKKQGFLLYTIIHENSWAEQAQYSSWLFMFMVGGTWGQKLGQCNQTEDFKRIYGKLEKQAPEGLWLFMPFVVPFSWCLTWNMPVNNADAERSQNCSFYTW